MLTKFWMRLQGWTWDAQHGEWTWPEGAESFRLGVERNAGLTEAFRVARLERSEQI